ncbi:hypothetical protein M413DRAFT_289523 [Hebeloma cylindrosporum]|uniref:HMG box domain-containing protein n=1 Tax=Hebeloma cylindrosporum TaxID=76867 RepID=A0A0C3BWE2_HEBCY|nr:hypothetical protein M413DRAFT_289523 [Hebeloma cylindrosporum h7]
MDDTRRGELLQRSCPPLHSTVLSKNLAMKSATSKIILPKPTYTPLDPSKKSHARKQPVGHIPRPRNAFILFRCDFVRQQKIPESVENDHRNISRIVGKIWREMTEEDKRPWVKMAEQEKHNHQQANPTYRFNPGIPNVNLRKKQRRGDDVPRETQEDNNLGSDEGYLALQRAASCPVGALRVPQANLESLTGYGTPMITRDDLARRPSRVTVYQSTRYDLQAKMKDPECYSDIANQHYFAEALATDRLPQPGADDPPQEDENGLPLRPQNGLFCGPRFDPRGDANAPIPRPGEGAVPEWDEGRSDSNVMAFDDWLASNHADSDVRLNNFLTSFSCIRFSLISIES